MTTTAPPDGLLPIDKPAGMTSHDVVAIVRGRLAGGRVGHTGTLDPMATGLLPLVLGRATRLARFLPDGPKRYVGSLRLGLTTDSDDVTGEPLTRHEGPLPPPREVLQAAERFRGELEQVPPRISAKKIDGRRAYRLARSGRPVEPRPVAVTVDRFDLAPTPDRSVWEFTAEVSAGTYLRSLARDLGTALGCGGTLLSLRRTAIGPLSVEGALAPPERERPWSGWPEALIPLAGMPLAPATVALEGDDPRRFVAGIAVEIDLAEAEADGPRRVVDATGEMLGIGEKTGDRLRPRVVVADR